MMASAKKPKSGASPALPPAHEAWLAVVRAYNLCDAVLAERLVPLGVKVTEHEVLVNLLLYPSATQQQLAAHSFTAKSVISVIVNKLEQGGMIERTVDTRDTRAWRLQLTAKGEKLARRALVVQNEVVSAMTADCSESELATLTRVSQRASAALEGLRGEY
jgi:DNA-binding MarR family transcriptional regulator